VNEEAVHLIFRLKREEDGGSVFLLNSGYHMLNSKDLTFNFHYCENISAMVETI
jgi:hypothetical protein